MDNAIVNNVMVEVLRFVGENQALMNSVGMEVLRFVGENQALVDNVAIETLSYFNQIQANEIMSGGVWGNGSAPVSLIGGGSVSVAQYTSQDTTSGTSVSASFNTLPQAGSTILVMAICSTANQPNISDNQGNAYKFDTYAPTQPFILLARASDIAAPSGTFTVTASVGSTSELVLAILEAHGLAAGSLDALNGDGGTISPADPGSITTTYSNELILAGMGQISTGGFTGLSSPWTSVTNLQTNMGCQVAYQIVTSINTFEPTWTLNGSGSWRALIGGYHS